MQFVNCSLFLRICEKLFLYFFPLEFLGQFNASAKLGTPKELRCKNKYI